MGENICKASISQELIPKVNKELTQLKSKKKKKKQKNNQIIQLKMGKAPEIFPKLLK